MTVDVCPQNRFNYSYLLYLVPIIVSKLGLCIQPTLVQLQNRIEDTFQHLCYLKLTFYATEKLIGHIYFVQTKSYPVHIWNSVIIGLKCQLFLHHKEKKRLINLQFGHVAQEFRLTFGSLFFTQNEISVSFFDLQLDLLLTRKENDKKNITLLHSIFPFCQQPQIAVQKQPCFVFLK